MNETATEKTTRLRAMIAPDPLYPTPWNVAETRREHVVVTCATGSYTANCPTDDAAEIIVAAVNAFAADPAPAAGPVGDVLRCPRCNAGVLWATDDGTVCTNPDPTTLGTFGAALCGAMWDSTGHATAYHGRK